MDATPERALQSVLVKMSQASLNILAIYHLCWKWMDGDILCRTVSVCVYADISSHCVFKRTGLALRAV